MYSKPTFCAVIVSYNRKLLLLQCLESLMKQSKPLDAIFLIDNASTDGTHKLLLKEGYIKNSPGEGGDGHWKESAIKNLSNEKGIKLYYIRMKVNTGGAGGFYEGVKRAYKIGYDWLWLMDDDAAPKEDALERLSEHCDEENISVLACVVKDIADNIQLLHRGFLDFNKNFPLIQNPLSEDKYSQQDSIDIDVASFVGILISRSAIEKSGFPKKEFFIQHDDIEYLIRLRSVGRILLITSSIITHKEQIINSKISRKLLWGKSMRIPFDRFWTTFYFHRNLVWIGKKYTLNKWQFYFYLFMFYLRYSIGILLLDDSKYKRIKLITYAYLDGLTNKFDNSRPKKILYDKR